jgi:GTP pyrophosphokinase
LVAAATVALRIPADKGTGRATGFFITPSIVATCAHAVAGKLGDREIEAEAGPRRFILRATTRECFQSADGLDVALLRLAEESEQELGPVLVANVLAAGDRLWTFGFPEGRYQGGKPANFVCEGFSKLRQGAELQLARVRGIPVGPGYSGSPVLNWRTGAVCGMLCTSDLKGSAHLLPIADILALSDELQETHAEPETHQRSWLDRLDDAQVHAGGWRYPGPAIRSYLTMALRAAELHPYPGVVPGIAPPTLSEVYVHPEALANSDSDNPSPEERKLPARTVFEPPGSSVLIGSAGAGKSSLLRTAVATEIREWQGGKPIRWVPVRVQAADLVAAQPLPQALADGVCEDLSAFGLKQSWPAGMFARPPFHGGEWLVLVDGLDELISAGHRQAVLTKLAGINAQDEHIFRFVVATRPLAEDKSAIPTGWAPRYFELLPFTNGQFSKVATNWFKWLELPETTVALERFLTQVQERDLAEIARNPLMATILCQLFAENPEASLPPGRSRIFDAFEELLNSRQYGSSAGGIRYQLVTTLRPFGQIAEDAGEKLLEWAPNLIRRLAWRRMNDDTAATIDLIDGWLADLKPRQVPVTAWHGVLRDLLRRSGVVQERAGDFVFFHRTIAEHLAAQHVASDAGRSNAEFDILFNQALWQGAPSYARFLIAAWSGRPDLPGALSHVLKKDGLVGAQFVASLRTDGIELPQKLYDGSLKRLASFAIDPKVNEADRRAAAETVLVGDKSIAIPLLTSAIRARSLSTSYRSWALEKLAAARKRLEPGSAPRSLESALLNAMRSLAEHDDAEGRGLIAFVASDSSWPRRGRKWAAQALQAAGKRPSDVLEPLIKTIQATHPRADIWLVERAYDVAAYWHRGQTRKSGDPYITHPLAIATILADLGMNIETICAALLHRTVEDTPYTLVELRGEFGEDIAALVDGVAKLNRLKYGEAAEAEPVIKMVVAISKDIRVVLIKLAARLHNMRTLRYLSRETQKQKAREVLAIYAPLAYRLGMQTVESELEDLAFATLYPKRYNEIAQLVSERLPEPDVFLQEVSQAVTADLREAQVKAQITSRQKTCYSIHQKMITRNVGFEEIYDLVRIRVLVDSVRDCYAVLGTIHARWNPIPGRFKDYIAMPKFHMYQSLHTTVIGPEGKPVELQIRTWGMHRRAEYGVAARWKYKEGSLVPSSRGGTASANNMVWLRQLIEWQRGSVDAAEWEQFLESMRFDLSTTEVYVFTPRGQVITLPQGATPVDFAYAIHTEVGHRCIGARVDGRLVALESALDSGDTVEIFTSKAPDPRPSEDWLNFVRSRSARKKIRQWFYKERREAAAENGRSAIARAIRKQGLPLQRLAAGAGVPAIAREMLAIAKEMHFANLAALYAAIGEGHVSAQSVVEKLGRSVGGLDGAQKELTEAMLPTEPSAPRPPDSGVEVDGAPNVSVRLSKCCKPVPGDEATGLVTHGGMISVHQAGCEQLKQLTGSHRERLLPVRWAPTEGSVFLIAIHVEALDRAGLLSDLAQAISDQHVNILSASVTTARDRVVVSKFTFEMGDPEHLGHVLRAIRAIDGVYDVYRVGQ